MDEKKARLKREQMQESVRREKIIMTSTLHYVWIAEPPPPPTSVGGSIVWTIVYVEE